MVHPSLTLWLDTCYVCFCYHFEESKSFERGRYPRRFSNPCFNPCFVVVVLLDGLLTPSRPTCVGDIVEYNCSIVDTALQWNYNGRLINFFSSQGIGFSNPRIISGIAFNTLYTPSDGVIISTVRFEANEISNNLQIICSRLNPSNTFSDNIKILNFSKCITLIFS